MDNLSSVFAQMEAFGIELREKDRDWIRDFSIEGKYRTIGAKGKDWCHLYRFKPDRGGVYITGSFGTFRHGGDFQKIALEWEAPTAEEKARMARERAAAAAHAAQVREAEIQAARLSALDYWRQADVLGVSPYLVGKGLGGESCRYLNVPLTLRWPARRPGENDTVLRLPAQTLVLPLLRYDLPREQALRGVQFIRPDGAKIYQRGFDKIRSSIRLGTVDPDASILLVVEGYATGLSVRAAIARAHPVFVALDAGNLAHVVPMLRELHPELRILVCADDDWQTLDKRTQEPTNPGRTIAYNTARAVPGVDLVYPVFTPATRQKGDTDFDDLRIREGLGVVADQLQGVLEKIEMIYG
jgi:putative DNA primase/helicase